MTLHHPTTSNPIPRRDLIDGTEFLSLFINSANKGSSTRNYKDIDSNENVNAKFDEILSDTTQKFEIDESNHHPGKPGDNNEFPKLDEERSTTNKVITKTTKNHSHGGSERKQIVQYVTSGSKVVFLEDLTPFDSIQKDQNSNDVSTETQSSEQTTKIYNTTEKSDQDASESELDVTEIDTTVLLDNEGHFDDVEAERGDFVSRSHKAELSVDISDPVTHGISDSMNSGSNFHQTHKKPDSRNDQNQKSIVPIQTVIYHDNYHKSMSAQPRSVSYTSISQNIDQPNSWPNSEAYQEAKKNVSEGLQPKNYQEPAKVYSEPAKVYGEPEKVYSEPAKVYSQPAQVYSQPAKFYSEPAKVYSEPAKVYSEPAKVYSEPAKTYWPTPLTTTAPMATTTTPSSMSRQTTPRKVIFNLDRLPYDLLNAPNSDSKLLEPTSSHHRNNGSVRRNSTVKHFEEDDGSYRPEHHGTIMVTQRPKYRPTHYTESTEEIYTPTPEQNYEVEESVSVKTNGRAHGIQPPSPSTVNPKEDSKVGYVFEGRNYRKYRVEEKTADGFIVGEYGVVSHNDGSLRGVRYTADSNINPSLIHDALMKFLSL